jgi:hypothetical protein
MPELKSRRMILLLQPDEYDRLASHAQRQVRAPEQQAEYYLKRAINRLPNTPKEGEPMAL